MLSFFGKTKKQIGDEGENAVVKYLKKKKYKILLTKYRTPYGEADVVAEKGDNLVFVEVKTRSSEAFGTPAEAVGRKKQERYINIAEYFLSRNPRYDSFFVRFDVAEVLGEEINYIENAFDCN